MNNDDHQAKARNRGVAARIGLCLLTFIAPGLGLVRLTQFKLGFGLIALGLAGMGLLQWFWSAENDMTYSQFLVLFGLAGGFALVATVVSLVLTWRRSRGPVLPRPVPARWYAIAGIALLIFGLNLLVTVKDRRPYRTFYAPSVSMAPTILAGDHFFARMNHVDPIRRGDLVIVVSRGIEYVKRVVALPGDSIALVNGEILLDGQKVPLQPIGPEKVTGRYGDELVTRLSEQLPGEKRPHFVFDGGATPQDDFPEVRLGPARYFLLGDNRDNSLDSRFEGPDGGLGLVAREQIVGRVLFRYWRKGSGLGEGQLSGR